MFRYYDYDPPELPVDTTVTLRCVNPNCSISSVGEEEPGETFHPKTYTEYQGEAPHGGPVEHYTLDSHECPECGEEGEEVR